jgi:hypothetical protein
MISKQNEVLVNLKNIIADMGPYSDFLIENFFYSLSPTVMRNVLDPQALKTLYLMLLNTLEVGIPKNQNFAVQFYRELEWVFVMISMHNPELKDSLSASLNKLNIATKELASIFVTAADTPCLGYIYHCDDPYKQEHFCQMISLAIDSWSNKELFSTRS